jgi:hypothetical protein
MIKFEFFFDIPSAFDKPDFTMHHDQYQEQIIGIYHEYRRYISAKQSLAKGYNLNNNFHSIIPLDIFGYFDTFITMPIMFTPVINNIDPNWFYNMFDLIYRDQLVHVSPDIVNIITSYVICYTNQFEFWKHVIDSLFNGHPKIIH